MCPTFSDDFVLLKVIMSRIFYVYLVTGLTILSEMMSLASLMELRVSVLSYELV